MGLLNIGGNGQEKGVVTGQIRELKTIKSLLKNHFTNNLSGFGK